MNQDGPRRRARINRPYPTHTLEDVLPIARAIQGSNSGLPMERELLASALGTTPSSSGFRMKLTSSAKYNLTVGGYNDENISLTPLGRGCVAPQSPNEARESLVKASSTPEIFRNFYRMLNGKRMPEPIYANNVLIRELSVHPDLALQCLETITANGLLSGIVNTDGPHLVVNFGQPTNSGSAEFTVSALPGSQQPQNSGTQDRQVGTLDETPRATPAISVVFVESTATVNRIVDMLKALGLTIVPGDLSAESQSLTLSATTTRAMQDCVAGIVIAPDVGSEARGPDAARERAGWLLLGAATFQYGEERVVVVETSPGSPWGPTPGIRTVAAPTDNLEATALGIVTALVEVGAIKFVT